MSSLGPIVLTAEQIIAALISAEPAVYKQVEDWITARKQTEQQAVTEMRTAGDAAVDAYEATEDAIKNAAKKT